MKAMKRDKTVQTGLIIRAVDFARVQERVAELERAATEACRDLEYLSDDEEFEFEWGYDDTPTHNIVIGPMAAYDERLGYPYLTGTSDAFADLLHEMMILYTEADVYVYTDDSSVEYIGDILAP